MSESQSAASKYWKANLSVLAGLLSVWFIASYGCGILFVDALNEWMFLGFPVGFWFAQNGAIYVFIVLIGAYVVLMNNLDKKYGFAED